MVDRKHSWPTWAADAPRPQLSAAWLGSGCPIFSFLLMLCFARMLQNPQLLLFSAAQKQPGVASQCPSSEETAAILR